MRTNEIIIKKTEDVISEIKKVKPKKIFIVTSHSFKKTELFGALNSEFSPIVWDNIRPNPRYEDMECASKLMRDNDCDFIIGAGGGSPLDSAKMIKLMATNENKCGYKETLDDNHIPFMAIPTTSGTGSEATRYSIFYHNEKDKYSVTHDGFLPQYVVLIPSLLKTLPPYQRRCTAIDALCHAIESYWNVNSNDKSKEYAKSAITLFMQAKDDYIDNNDLGNKKMLYASYYGGKAIDITSTTVAHAMCYNVTMNCNTSHGHSVGANMISLWRFMLTSQNAVNDKRGREYVDKTFLEIAQLLGGTTAEDGLTVFQNLMNDFELESPSGTEKMAQDFAKTVNASRLLNNPIHLETVDVENIYKSVFGF